MMQSPPPQYQQQYGQPQGQYGPPQGQYGQPQGQWQPQQQWGPPQQQQWGPPPQQGYGQQPPQGSYGQLQQYPNDKPQTAYTQYSNPAPPPQQYGGPSGGSRKFVASVSGTKEFLNSEILDPAGGNIPFYRISSATDKKGKPGKETIVTRASNGEQIAHFDWHGTETLTIKGQTLKLRDWMSLNKKQDHNRRTIHIRGEEYTTAENDGEVYIYKTVGPEEHIAVIGNPGKRAQIEVVNEQFGAPILDELVVLAVVTCGPHSVSDKTGLFDRNLFAYGVGIDLSNGF